MKTQAISTIRKLSDYVRFIEENCEGDQVLFRGQPVDKPLLPKIARLVPKPDVGTAERSMLEDFRLQALPYIETRPENDWDWLALAQHFGMATRLLDWTINPLAALWFAVERPANEGESGVIWMFTAEENDFLKRDEGIGPFEIDRTRVFRPRHITRRIIAQSGWFTAHRFEEDESKPYVPLDQNKRYKQRLVKLKVPADAFWSLRADLDRCGVNGAALYGGLDGLCRHIEWLHSFYTDEVDQPDPPTAV